MLILIFLVLLALMAFAPIYAARARGKPALGGLVAAISFTTGAGLHHYASTTWWDLGWVWSILIPLGISFGFALLMLLRRPEPPARRSLRRAGRARRAVALAESGIR